MALKYQKALWFSRQIMWDSRSLEITTKMSNSATEHTVVGNHLTCLCLSVSTWNINQIMAHPTLHRPVTSHPTLTTIQHLTKSLCGLLASFPTPFPTTLPTAHCPSVHRPPYLPQALQARSFLCTFAMLFPQPGLLFPTDASSPGSVTSFRALLNVDFSETLKWTSNLKKHPGHYPLTLLLSTYFCCSLFFSLLLHKM